MKAATPWLLLAAIVGCAPAAPRPTTATPTSTPTPTATATPIPTQTPTAAPRRAPFDPSVVVRVLDDPRLAGARALADKGKLLEAARAVEKADDASLGSNERARWAYLAGLFANRGGDPKGAAASFERAAALGGPLSPFALLEAGELRLATGDASKAVEKLAAIPEGAVPRARLDPLLARALVRAGRTEEGLARFRAAVARHDVGWPALALELARALLAHPGSDRALEAARLALDVELDGPTSRAADAKKVKESAVATLASADRKWFDAPATDERAARAKRLVASGRGKLALALTDTLAKKADASCAVLDAHADALDGVGRSSEASAEYERALRACASAPGFAGAPLLYDAGRAAERGGNLALAIARFTELETSFPSSELADDARVARAKAALENGDRQAFEDALGTLAETYPKGDATPDGVFLLALELMKAGEWQRAVAPLEIGKTLPKERSYTRAGRFDYYLGRALVEAGRADEGEAELARTIADYPLSYYAALAYGRLEVAARGRGAAALDRALATESAPPEAPPDDVIASGPFQAAIALASLDDADGVEDALDVLGVGDRSAAPELTLAGAELLATTTSPSAAHAILRSASEYEPRVGRNEVYAYRDAQPTGAWRAVWEAAYPRAYAAEVERAAAESGLPPTLLYAIAREESAFEPRAVSRVGAIGLTQVMPGTAKRAAKRLALPSDDEAIRDPGENLRLGAHFLKQMRDEFSDDVLLAIPAYNAGPKAPSGWATKRPGWSFDLFVEDIPYAETRSYTKRVLSSLAAYDLLYGSRDASEVLHAPLLARAAP